jgi:hypothetical protein
MSRSQFDTCLVCDQEPMRNSRVTLAITGQSDLARNIHITEAPCNFVPCCTLYDPEYPSHVLRSFHVSGRAPSLRLCFLLKESKCQAIELGHEGFDFWFVKKNHVIRNSLAYDIPQTLVVIWRSREYVVTSDGEGLSIPEMLARTTELRLTEVLEADDIVLVGYLIHLGMNKELGSISQNWRDAQLATEVIAGVVTTDSTTVVLANLPY